MKTNSQNINIKRIQRISRNFFLHIHSPKIHPHALRPTYTFGLGVILAFLFLIMIITGFILMMNYTPSVEQAYNSVKDIVFVVPGGKYIRNIHRWAAHGMVLVTFLHLTRTFLTGSYFGKRKWNWIIGICMLLVVMFMSFSGYLLPWDQLAYWAVTIGSNIAASARELTDILGITNVLDIGGFFKKLLIGDETVGQTALTRFFMLHVVFLPITLMVLTGWHFWRIRKDGGLSRPLREESASPQVLKPSSLQYSKAGNLMSDDVKFQDRSDPDRERPPVVQAHGSISSKNQDTLRADKRIYTWPVLMWIELSLLLFTTTIILIMAFVFDAPLREQANISFPENPAKSSWYFLGIQELVSYSAFTGGLLIPLLFIAFLISIPFIDKEDRFSGIWFSGKQGLKIGAVTILYSLLITVILVFIAVKFGWFREWFGDIPGFIIMIINPGTLSALFYILWSILIKTRTGSTRMAAIALFLCAMTGLIIYTSIGIWFRGPNWDFYWSQSQWPMI
ncbi:MAG: hypothetical protein AMS27_04105 [Bacteroides sp. SM23_62_1]|nr:MAG: hypothetical protein AMS27_04105 [Bacteroides sp. SM23_62_1]